jgi:hypothetical protein
MTRKEDEEPCAGRKERRKDSGKEKRWCEGVKEWR